MTRSPASSARARESARAVSPGDPSRRRLLRGSAAGLASLALPGCLLNPCRDPRVMGDPEVHALVEAAWSGVDPNHLWDCHVHLLGTGDAGTGAWVSPDMRSPLNPAGWVRFRVFLNAACAGDGPLVDDAYVERLLACVNAMPAGVRLMLLAFDYTHDEAGRRVEDASAFHIPNRYADLLSKRHPRRFEWVASIHPWREDAVEALAEAVANGARAVKWLPNAMGIDPASARCDRFYAAVAAAGIPILTHAGEEGAVHGAGAQHLGNPLRLRRALEHGVKVVVAHCASLGEGADLDRGEHGPRVPNIDLFARLMDEPAWEDRLFGDVSAVVQTNRLGHALDTLLERTEWHPRLVYGSDYPLPGAPVLFDLGKMAARGYIPPDTVAPLGRLQEHNPLAFDFVLKRTVRRGLERFSRPVFESRRVFASALEA